MCFLHANAIAELIDLGNNASGMEWPAFVGYCICTAGTVHVHGVHYSVGGGSPGDMNFFGASADFLSREMQQLSELRYAWASAQHQRETLQGIYNAHAELVKSMSGNPMRYTPGFHLEDFFDRYTNIGGTGGQSFHFDAANLSLSDVVIDVTAEAYTAHDLYALRSCEAPDRPALKRKNTGSSLRKRPDVKSLAGLEAPPTQSQKGAARHGRSRSGHNMTNHASPALMMTPAPLQSHNDNPEHYIRVGNGMHNSIASNNMPPVDSTGFAMPGHSRVTHNLSHLGDPNFNNPYDFIGGQDPSQHEGGVVHNANAVFDPMFGSLPANTFTSPSAWHGDNSQNQNLVNQVPTAGKAAPSPGQKSNNGSTGTGQPDEKDPFLSLLEQLAENEKHFGTGMGSDLDFFLTGGHGA